jgi:hypothetical protein
MLKTINLVQKNPLIKEVLRESDGTDHDNDGDIDSEDYLKSRDIAIKSNTEERYTNALWKSVEAIASEGFSRSNRK